MAVIVGVVGSRVKSVLGAFTASLSHVCCCSCIAAKSMVMSYQMG